ncbi:MAG: nitroreductase family deazaflavin-dependent oxidoreductase [Candidatus Binatia bacterium]
MNRYWRWVVACACGMALLLNSQAFLVAQEAKSVTKADLEKVANESYVEITTTGRKSGTPHTKPIWFVYDQGHFYIQSGGEGKTDWYLNLKKTPQFTLKIGSLIFNGKAKFIDDAQETERVHGLFRAKYTRARLAGLVGSQIGHGKVVEVELQPQ